MVNKEHKLTVDDLIVEYMMYKVINGYEPSFFTSEFVTFLDFFESKMEVFDVLYENNKLFQRFFERKNKHDWSRTKDFRTMEQEARPHMEMEYVQKYRDYLIKANYLLSDFDKSIINTYFMDNGMGKFDHFKGQTFKIRSIIGEWLVNYPKRKIDETIEYTDDELMVGKYIAAQIIMYVWDSYVKKHIKCVQWPKQCGDIDKYLFEIDLAEIIGVKSVKKELLELYSVFSKRIAILYHQDKNLKISSYSNGYLARANYELLIQGYEKIMDTTFSKYSNSLEIDLSNLTFKESHVIDGVYDWDDDPDVKTTTTNIGNENVKKLVRTFDDTINNIGLV